MGNTLFEICDAKREIVKGRKATLPEAILATRAKRAAPARGFLKALKAADTAGEMAIIAEIKKASPSKGIIREDFDPVSCAKAYEAGGATCLSVLTDEQYFQGSDDDFKNAHAAVSIPVLRKDFIVDPYQVYESRMLGADAILLIMAALSERQAEEMESLAMSLGMDVLVEVHSNDDLNRALSTFRSELIGVNNRDLRTLEVDLEASRKLAERLPAHIFPISESGISSNEDIKNMHALGYKGFLVGTCLMQQNDLTQAVKMLKSA